MTINFIDPHNLYNDQDLRVIDRASPTTREGWVDYTVDEKDLRPYVGVDLNDQQEFFRKFSQDSHDKTEALWQSLKRFAIKTGNQDFVLTQEEIAPIHTRAYEIAWGSIYRGLKMNDGFLEFPPEMTPIPLEPFTPGGGFRPESVNQDFYDKARPGINVEKLAADFMKGRIQSDGVDRDAELITVFVWIGSITRLSLDDLEKRNKERYEHATTHDRDVTLGLRTDEPSEANPIEGFRFWGKVYKKHNLFQIKEQPAEVIATIAQNYYDPQDRWEQSGEMVFQVENQRKGNSTVTVRPKEGVIEERDASGKTTRLERAKTPWKYDNFLFSHGLPFSLVHYKDQFPVVVEETSVDDYKISIHNPAVPTETAELYFHKGSYLFAGYKSNGTVVSFGSSLLQDPKSGIRYPSEKGSGILAIEKEGMSDVLTPLEMLTITSKGGAL